MKKEFVEVKRGELLAKVGELLTGNCRLSTLSGVDNSDGIEALYTFDVGEKLLTLRVTAKQGETLPSITNLVPAASLYERELSEMFGVQLEGHPSPGRLMLPDNFAGAPPLLKKTPGGKND